ncbi:hypothetical protein [Vibrio parahaemolyticus]|uniref:hypothetical protein n=1 Tax=Vibrio parahaemolyticus TaxID=670 RepID=UPI002362DF5B|nr:hypothetical protein [Vibrio parahaemolyticus]
MKTVTYMVTVYFNNYEMTISYSWVLDETKGVSELDGFTALSIKAAEAPTIADTTMPPVVIVPIEPKAGAALITVIILTVPATALPVV